MDTEKDLSLMEELFTVLMEDEERSSAEHGENQADSESENSGSGYELIQFIDEIPGGFCIYSAEDDEQILYVNKALLRIFRCKTEEEFMEYVGGTFRGMVHPHDVDQVLQSIEEQVKANEDGTDYVEYRIIAKDGVTRWVEDYGHYVNSDLMGGVFYVFITDATDKVCRRMAEKEEGEQKLKSLTEEYDQERKRNYEEQMQRLEVLEGLSTYYDSILYVDLEKDMVLPYRLNKRIAKQFKAKMEVRSFLWFMNDYVNSWVHPDDYDLFAERISIQELVKRLSGVHTFYLDYRTVEDGEIRYTRLRVVNVGEDEDKVSKIIIVARDIGDERAQELNQKYMLEDALRTAELAEVAKNTFLSNMSHDMRTPLNALFGYTALAGKNAENPEAVRNYLGKIEQAGQQILDLIAKVLDITYTESQEFRLDETDCNIGNLLREVHDAAFSLAVEKKIVLSLDVRELHHENVVCDGEKLKQILSNIVHNAVKYTKKNGSVTIAVTEGEKHSNGKTDYDFTVKDTGIGIRQENLERIFEPFERERNTTFSGEFGSGLGLTIARRLAEAMGGEIKVESIVGEGSTFTVSVGLKVQSGNQSEEDDKSEADFNGKKVLIVEDNEINMEIETEIFTELGCVVETAENGKIAVEKIAASAPGEYALIIMDIQMPVMDGREAARAIRALPDPVLSRIPIVALSANAFESDKIASLESGMDAHLTKPIDVPVLTGTMKSVMK